MYNNPYLYNNYPYQGNNLFRRGNIFNQFKGKKFNWTNILNNTQKTLNLINQAIPVYYQVKPIYNNAKTMFRMVNALKDNENNNKTTNNTDNNIKKIEPLDNNDGPVFFI